MRLCAARLRPTAPDGPDLTMDRSWPNETRRPALQLPDEDAPKRQKTKSRNYTWANNNYPTPSARHTATHALFSLNANLVATILWPLPNRYCEFAPLLLG